MRKEGTVHGWALFAGLPRPDLDQASDLDDIASSRSYSRLAVME